MLSRHTRVACVAAIAVLVFLPAALLLTQATWIHAKAILAQQLLQHAWQQQLRAHSGSQPWPWADVAPVAVLQVPRLGMKQVVLDSDAGAALAFAPGHARNSALPGHAGVSLLVAHRDTHFSFLRELTVDDAIYIVRGDGREVQYRVTRRQVIDTREGELQVRGTAPTLLLVTCYPFDAVLAGTPYRYVVTAQAVTTVSSGL